MRLSWRLDATATTTEGIAKTPSAAGDCGERSATNARSAASGSFWPQGGNPKITVTDHPTEPFQFDRRKVEKEEN